MFSNSKGQMAQKLLWRTHIQAVTTLRSNFAKKILVYDLVFTAQLTHTILAREKSNYLFEVEQFLDRPHFIN